MIPLRKERLSAAFVLSFFLLFIFFIFFLNEQHVCTIFILKNKASACALAVCRYGQSQDVNLSRNCTPAAGLSLCYTAWEDQLQPLMLMGLLYYCLPM